MERPQLLEDCIQMIPGRTCTKRITTLSVHRNMKQPGP